MSTRTEYQRLAAHGRESPVLGETDDVLSRNLPSDWMLVSDVTASYATESEIALVVELADTWRSRVESPTWAMVLPRIAMRSCNLSAPNPLIAQALHTQLEPTVVHRALDALRELLKPWSTTLADDDEVRPSPEAVSDSDLASIAGLARGIRIDELIPELDDD